MIYLESFQPNMDGRHVYPWRVICPMQLEHIEFAPITIFYGNNGSGKSTLLNVIANRIGIRNKTMGNTNEYFDGYVFKCTFTLNGKRIPIDSTLIRSEDIMADIVESRCKFEQMMNEIKKDNLMVKNGISRETVNNALFGLDLVDPDEYSFLSRYEDFVALKTRLTESSDMRSNGEKALDYFKEHLFEDGLFMLDEPENSMAPSFQQELAKEIAILAYRLNSQFVIATHSPFILSLEGARIYDLDSRPTQIRQWYELENMSAYYKLFKRFEKKFGLVDK
jgi:predicted ATPase